jgi:hypothetical protein
MVQYGCRITVGAVVRGSKCGIRRQIMDKQAIKRHAKRKERFGRKHVGCERPGTNGTTNVHIVPSGTATEDVVERLLEPCMFADGLLVVVRGDENDIVCLLPSADRERLESQDSQFQGKLIALMTEDQARGFGIL